MAEETAETDKEIVTPEHTVASMEIVKDWYVLNYIATSSRDTAEKTVDRFNTIHETTLELFAPTYVVKAESRGELKLRKVKLTFHYVFVKGRFEDVKRLCGQPNGFSFLIDHGSSERYATISDRRMAHFKNIARAYKNCLPYFPLDEIDLEDGDLVEVVSGDFPGLIGTYMPNPKSKSGNIILNVFNNVGTIAFNVKATDVRVLEFSRHATRANDQIDAFVPVLFEALRHYDRGEELPTGLAAKLSIFCGRMSAVKMNNRKLEAKLRALLYSANTIIGDQPEASRALGRYRELSASVTNEWTKALVTLIFAVTDRNKTALNEIADKFNGQDPAKLSKAQRQLIGEYNTYVRPSLC